MSLARMAPTLGMVLSSLCLPLAAQAPAQPSQAVTAPAAPFRGLVKDLAGHPIQVGDLSLTIKATTFFGRLVFESVHAVNGSTAFAALAAEDFLVVDASGRQLSLGVPLPAGQPLLPIPVGRLAPGAWIDLTMVSQQAELPVSIYFQERLLAVVGVEGGPAPRHGIDSLYP